MALKVYYSKVHDTIKASELGLLRDIWETYDPKKSPGDYILFAGVQYLFQRSFAINHNSAAMECDAVLLTPHALIFIELKKYNRPSRITENAMGGETLVELKNGSQYVKSLNSTSGQVDSFAHGMEQPRKRIKNLREAKKDDNIWFAGVDKWPNDTLKGILMIGDSKRGGAEHIIDMRYTYSGNILASGSYGLIFPVSNRPTKVEETIDNSKRPTYITDFWGRVNEIERMTQSDNFFTLPKHRDQVENLFLRNAYSYLKFDVKHKSKGRNVCSDKSSARALKKFENKLRGIVDVPKGRDYWGCILSIIVVAAVVALIWAAIHYVPYYWKKPARLKTHMEELYQKANDGDAAACLALSDSCVNGTGVARDLETALDWLKKAEENGSAEAYERHGDYYRAGHVVDKKNPERAVDKYLGAANWGNINVLTKVEETLSEANMLKTYREAILYYVKTSVDRELSPEHNYRLAATYAKSNPSKTYDLMYKAADMRYTPAVYWMWHYYTSVRPNKAKALEWARLYSLRPNAKKQLLPQVEATLEENN